MDIIHKVNFMDCTPTALEIIRVWIQWVISLTQQFPRTWTNNDMDS